MKTRFKNLFKILFWAFVAQAISAYIFYLVKPAPKLTVPEKLRIDEARIEMEDATEMDEEQQMIIDNFNKCNKDQKKKRQEKLRGNILESMAKVRVQEPKEKDEQVQEQLNDTLEATDKEYNATIKETFAEARYDTAVLLGDIAKDTLHSNQIIRTESVHDSNVINSVGKELREWHEKLKDKIIPYETKPVKEIKLEGEFEFKIGATLADVANMVNTIAHEQPENKEEILRLQDKGVDDARHRCVTGKIDSIWSQPLNFIAEGFEGDSLKTKHMEEAEIFNYAGSLIANNPDISEEEFKQKLSKYFEENKISSPKKYLEKIIEVSGIF